MKLTLKFLIPLLTFLSLVAYMTIPVWEYVTNRWFMRDLEARSSIISDALQGSLAPLLAQGTTASQRKKINLMERMSANERVLAVGYCNPIGELELRTSLFPEEISCSEFADQGSTPIRKDAESGVYLITSSPLEYEAPGSEEGRAPELLQGKVIVVHDMTFAARRTKETKTYLFLLFLAIGLVTSFFGVLIARWSMRGWIRSVRNLLTGAYRESPPQVEHKEFLPLIQDVKNLIRELDYNRSARDDLNFRWTPQTLKEILNTELAGDEIMVVANRQPYIHVYEGDTIKVLNPASGLVTAMEPIVRACSGVWIAHGNGSADRAIVDSRDRVAVPPGKNEYDIHRVWLSKEEEKGYYYGFANEGLWPLCHMAHTRPVFRQSDWEMYKLANQKFADAVVADAQSESPVVLVQDYHFALLPRMIRERLPDATVITFWHIPWPNPEAFGICPWREEILDGLLGSSIMGFHIRFHRNNFVETVDRFLESRIDQELSSISYRGHSCMVRSYPISIEWPPRLLPKIPPAQECSRLVRERDSIGPDVIIGLGVDRLDYTKGIVERFGAVERLLEAHPEWIGRFSFVQIAAPSRSSLPAYQSFDDEVRAIAERVNGRFGRDGYNPIVLKIEHHGPELVYEYMRAAKICFVSSLHDGMNLVAKEYIAAHDDELGVLVLSMFAGASRELAEALIVNPYDLEQCKDALHIALSMDEREQRERMRAMRSFVRDFNIYRWAGKMLLDAASIRRKNRFLARYAASSLQNQTGFYGP